MSEPDFMICVECETPVYTFEWDDAKARPSDVLCPVCGNDEVDEFQTEDEYNGEA